MKVFGTNIDLNIYESDWVDDNYQFFSADKNDKIFELKNSGIINQDLKNYANMYYMTARQCSVHFLFEIKMAIPSMSIPILFLYRNAIEQLLKAKLFETESEQIAYNLCNQYSHDLSLLLQHLINKNLVNENEISCFDDCKNFINSISHDDKMADLFRYPMDISGFQSYEKLKNINITELIINMMHSYNILSYLLYNEFDKTQFKSSDDLKNSVWEQSDDNLPLFDKPLDDEHSYFDYIIGYNECLRYLYEYKGFNENNILPFLYLNRNLLELSLKKVFFKQLVDGVKNPLRVLNKKKHSLQGLWNKFKTLCDNENGYQLTAYDDKNSFEKAEKFIEELHNIDLNSDIFRYPISKYQKKYFVGKEKQIIGLEYSFTWFTKLLNVIEAADVVLSDVKDMENALLKNLIDIDLENL